MTRPSLLLLAALFATTLQARADTLTVAVAANLQYAFGDLSAAFTKASGHDIKPVYNSSGKFASQIMNGAPFDVFMSADTEFPEKLYEQGYTASAPKVYARGALVLWTLKDLDLANWQATLAGPGVARIAVANPQLAPYGRETMKALAHFKLDQTLKPKLVFGESIAQTNQYIHSKAADAGFTAKSVVVSPEMQGKGKWVELPKSSYTPIAQAAVILKHGAATSPKATQQFFDFLFSPAARSIFERYGYLLP